MIFNLLSIKINEIYFIDFINNNCDQSFKLIDCVLIDNEFDEPPYTLKWVDRKLIWTWKYIRMQNNKYIIGTEEWITPLKDYECWCFRKQKWKGILNIKALPGMLEAINPDNKMCIIRANRFNHQNNMACWFPGEKYWSIGITPRNVDEFDPDQTIKIWCKIPNKSETWRWLYYVILDEEDKILLRWSHVLREDE